MPEVYYETAAIVITFSAGLFENRARGQTSEPFETYWSAEMLV